MCGCGFLCGEYSGSVDGYGDRTDGFETGALVGVPKQQVDKTVSKVEEQDDYDEYQGEGYSANSSIGPFGGGYYSQVSTSPASSLTGGSTSLKGKRTPPKSGTGSAGTLILYLVLFGAVCLVNGAQDLSAENELKNGSTSSAAQNGGFLIPTGPWLIVVIVLATVGILALLGLCILGAWYLWRRVPAGAVRSSSTSSSDEDSLGAGSSSSAPRNEIRKEKKVVRANRRGTKSPAKDRKNLDKRTSSPKKQIQSPKQSPLQIVSREEKKKITSEAAAAKVKLEQINAKYDEKKKQMRKIKKQKVEATELANQTRRRDRRTIADQSQLTPSTLSTPSAPIPSEARDMEPPPNQPAAQEEPRAGLVTSEQYSDSEHPAKK